jgi:ABC exporter DevB family membrane fusion protein
MIKFNLTFFKPLGSVSALLLLGTTLATAVATTYVVTHLRSNDKTPVAVSAQKPVAPVAVSARGYLEPEGEVIKVSAPAFMEGARVDKLLVQRGDRVKVDQVIAILDSRDRLQAALIQAQAQIGISASRLAQVKAGAKQGDIIAQDARFARTKAELEGQLAIQRATIASLEAQQRGEKAAQQATIERIRAEVVNAQTDCRRYQTLHADGAVSEQERDRFCLQAKTTDKSLKEAEANLKRIITTMDENIKEARANLRRTILTLDQQIKESQATLASVEEVRPVDVQAAEAELLSSQAAVQRAEAELALASVKAPKSGQILKIHTWPGELVSNDGIVDLGQTNQMYVTAEVYETDISRVKLGQIARIKTNDIIGDLEGTVDEIGLQIGRQDVLGTDPAADADARVVEVKIRLNPQSSEKVAGLTNLEVNLVIDTPDN